MQPVDYTTLVAACAELRAMWLPARLEQVYQRDRFTVALALRTLDQRGWLTLSWHPQAARVCMGDAPPRTADTFTFSQQLRHQIGNLALTSIEAIAPWERVLDLQFARRPTDPPMWHLYVEIMGKYSNVILVTADNTIVTAAHQVSAYQSSVRPIQTGQPYEVPPVLLETNPTLEEPLAQWQQRISLVPGALRRNILKNYRGLSSNLLNSMIAAVGLDPEQSTATLRADHWQQLFQRWQEWLHALEQQQFQPGFLSQGYTVMGWGAERPATTVQELLHRYYTDQLNQQIFLQLRHQISQRLINQLKKLYTKAQEFQRRLQQSDQADLHKDQADLLMAYLHHWQPGMKAIALPDFATGEQVTIPLDPEKNAVQNAQTAYKRHQKLKRSRSALEPLLADVKAEIEYLEQVEVAIAQVDHYQTADDLSALEEIRDELIQQGYMQDPEQRHRNTANQGADFRHFTTPSGFEVLVGRNNRQNDQLTFRLAGDYDLWFHSQEIPGSHLLLRVPPGAVADEGDLQFMADLAAYYSRANQSEQVPVVYTTPKHVFKPRGAKPGMAVYKQETVIWGQPQRAASFVQNGVQQSG